MCVDVHVTSYNIKISTVLRAAAPRVALTTPPGTRAPLNSTIYSNRWIRRRSGSPFPTKTRVKRSPSVWSECRTCELQPGVQLPSWRRQTAPQSIVESSSTLRLSYHLQRYCFHTPLNVYELREDAPLPCRCRVDESTAGVTCVRTTVEKPHRTRDFIACGLVCFCFYCVILYVAFRIFTQVFFGGAQLLSLPPNHVGN